MSKPRSQEWWAGYAQGMATGIEQGQRDERERIRTGVTGLASPSHHYVWNDCVNEVIAVIDGEDSA